MLEASPTWKRHAVYPFTRVFGIGDLLTTVDDFLKWQAALQGGGAWGPDLQPITPDPAGLVALAGVYHSPRTEEVLVLPVRDGRRRSR